MTGEPRSAAKPLFILHGRGNFKLTLVKFEARRARPARFSMDDRRQSPPPVGFRTVAGIEMDQSASRAVD